MTISMEYSESLIIPEEDVGDSGSQFMFKSDALIE